MHVLVTKQSYLQDLTFCQNEDAIVSKCDANSPHLYLQVTTCWADILV